MLRLKGTAAIYEMEEKLGVKVKFIHVVRNPFDNIATFVLRHRDIQARSADPNIKVTYSNDYLRFKYRTFFTELLAHRPSTAFFWVPNLSIS